MAATAVLMTQPEIVRLDWECNHFGLFAAQLAALDLNDTALAAALGLARHEGVQLLVWPGPGGRDVPPEILAEFGGALVDRKATFARPLTPSHSQENGSLTVESPVVPLTGGPDIYENSLGGMITLSESGGVASIGLVAVAAVVRGRGIGLRLMQAAHGWMRQRGAHRSQVTTQLANLPACRLYERAGYGLARLQHYYHFWL